MFNPDFLYVCNPTGLEIINPLVPISGSWHICLARLFLVEIKGIV